MAEGQIIVDVDDTAVDIAIAKLKMAVSISQKTFGTPQITKGAASVKKSVAGLSFTLTPVTDDMEKLRYQMAQLGTADLPSLNRELRLILGQVPGMREAIWTYFRFKRVYGQLAKSIEAGAPTLGLYLTAIATLILVVKYLMDRQRKMEQRQQQYETFIRRQRGWTYTEYTRLIGEHESYFRSSPG